MKKKFMSTLLVLCLLLTLFPDSALATEQAFTITSNGVLTKYSGSEGDIIIPDTVVTIGRAAFRECLTLTDIHIPNSVVSIENQAFYGCTGLKSVVIPSSVTSIGSDAFYGCKNLKDVTIPSSVKSIGSDAFFNTQWSKDLGDFSIANGILFGYRKTAGGAVAIPDDVLSISSYVFSFNDNITDITIPNSVKTIGHNAFYKCSNLTAVHLSQSITELSAHIFSGCTQLSEITIPDSITAIGYEAFRDCSNLTSIIIPENVKSMGDSVFSGCRNLSKVIIPQSVTSTGHSIFRDCPALTTAGPVRAGYAYNIQFGWTDIIPNEVFFNCTSLTAITLPNTIREIGSMAFYGTNITDVYFLGTEEEWNAVSGNQQLDSATIHFVSNKDFEKHFYIEQAFGDSCTLASVAMMLRRKAMLDENRDWQSITEASIFSSVWAEGTWRTPYAAPKKEYLRGRGVKWDFTYNGMVVHSLGKEVREQGDKIAYFISELERHPEGIVIYDQGKHQHAVLLISYNPALNEFICADPAQGYGIVSLKDSYIAQNHGGTQEAVISTIDQTWYIGSSASQKNIQSTEINSACPVEMRVTINDTVLDSSCIDGIISNSYATMTASGSGMNRNISVTVAGNLTLGKDIAVELIGQETGTMTFTVTQKYTDNSIETQIFQDVPVTSTITGNAHIYPQSTVLLTLHDSEKPESQETWAANPNETAATPNTDFETAIPDLDLTIGFPNWLYNDAAQTVTISGTIPEDEQVLIARYGPNRRFLGLEIVTRSKTVDVSGNKEILLAWVNKNTHIPLCAAKRIFQ